VVTRWPGKVFTAIKLAYLHFLYWFVGLDEEGFLDAKGHYLFELGSFSAAAKSYQRALSRTTSPRIHGSLGYCYLNLGIPDKPIQSFHCALERKADPVHEIGLAWAHLGLGEEASCEAVVAKLRRGNSALDAWVSHQLAELEAQLREKGTREGDQVPIAQRNGANRDSLEMMGSDPFSCPDSGSENKLV
jgi:hypothetical protein